MKRRDFLTAIGAVGLAGAHAAAAETPSVKTPPASQRRQPIAISSYSFWRFLPGLKMPMTQCIDQAAQMGFDALEILHVQMQQEDNAHQESYR